MKKVLEMIGAVLAIPLLFVMGVVTCLLPCDEAGEYDPYE